MDGCCSLPDQHPGGGQQEQPKSNRQELQERRVAAQQAKNLEEGKKADPGKASSFDAQIKVQNVVVQAMGFTPGFDTYKLLYMPDGYGYRPYTVYANQQNVDNKRLGRGLYGPSDSLHNELVESQYNRGD